MKSSPSVLIIAVCLGSLVAALVATLMAAPEATDMTTSSPQRVVAELPKELFEQLRDLERRNEALQERITALENGPVETKRFGDKATVTREELDAVASRVEELLEGRTVPRALETKVADTLQAIRKQENAVRRAKKEQATVARRDARVEAMRTRLNLDSRQVADLRLHFEARAERDRELSRAWEAGELDRAAAGALKRTNQQAHLDGLATILTPAQLELHRTPVPGGRGK